MLGPAKKAIQALYFNSPSATRLLLRCKAGGRRLGPYYGRWHGELAAIEERLRVSLRRSPRAIRVVFLVTENAKWNVQSVYDALEDSADFEPAVLTFPGNHTAKTSLSELAASERQNREFFVARKIRVRPGWTEAGGYVELAARAPDVVFYEQPHQFLPDALWVQQVGRYALPCYVGYGIMVARIQQLQFNRDFHHRMWRIFAETERHRSLFGKYSVVGDRHVLVTGHPKLDVYLEPEPEAADGLWSLPRSSHSEVKRVIWAPHFSVKNREVAFSTFHRYYEHFYELARRDPRIDWVVKPHPWLRMACVKYGLMSQAEVDAYCARWQALPNAKMHEQGGYFDLFRTSDALILDSVSFVAEYMPTARPMLFLVNREPPLVGFNEFGEDLQTGLYKARSAADIDAFIANTLFGGDDPIRPQREAQARRVLYQSGGGAGRAIRDHLVQRLLD